MRKKGVYQGQASQRQLQIVRVFNTDLDGSKQILYALRKVKGVSHSISNAVLHELGMPKDRKVSELKDDEIEKIEKMLEKLSESMPAWMLNRRKDYETGVDTHLFQSDLMFGVEKDTRRMKRLKSYKGGRHQAGLPVRGQKTRSNFRRNKGKATGVKKKGKK
jgi:small subunit ribosomal protein S13